MELEFSYSINYQKFYIHSGVSEILRFFADNFQKKNFIFFLITGSPRSGKTALAFKFLNLTNQNYGILNASFFNSNEFNLSAYQELSTIIIDDFDSVMTNIARFVDLYNFCKSNNIILVATGDKIENDDPNVSSRLLSGMKMQIGFPTPDDLPGIIKSLGVQSGVRLETKIIDYLATRLPCSIRVIEEFYTKLNQKLFQSNSKITKKLIEEILLN